MLHKIVTIAERNPGDGHDVAIVAGELVGITCPTKKRSGELTTEWTAVFSATPDGMPIYLGVVPTSAVQPVDICGRRYKNIASVPNIDGLLCDRSNRGGRTGADCGVGTTPVSLLHIAREYNRSRGHESRY